jgi:hypothetical protein
MGSSATRKRLDRAREGPIDLSHRINAHPELGFDERVTSS